MLFVVGKEHETQLAFMWLALMLRSVIIMAVKLWMRLSSQRGDSLLYLLSFFKNKNNKPTRKLVNNKCYDQT